MTRQDNLEGVLDAPTLARLAEIGIATREDLELIGVRAAYEMLRELYPDVTPRLLGQLERATRRGKR